MPPPSRIALLLGPAHSSRMSETLAGIRAYAEPRAGWNFLLECLGDANDNRPATWNRADGVIANVAYRPELARQLAASGIPTVSIESATAPLPRVVSDNVGVGRLAAEHFQERGFRHFGFCGFPGIWFSDMRQSGFSTALNEAGHACSIFDHSNQLDSFGHYGDGQLHQAIGRWLSEMPTPIGILAGSDIRARHLITATHQIGLQMPEQVAVLGVDNDPFVCDVTRPTLSSIPLDMHRVGWQAAEHLAKLMKRPRKRLGDPPPVPPRAVVERHSTNVLAHDDVLVAQSLRFLREHAHEPISVMDVLSAVPLSRRMLELRFKQAMGRTLLQEIRRVRMARACQLLEETFWAVDRVARECGFTSLEHFYRAFRQARGQTPGEYRLKARSWTQGS